MNSLAKSKGKQKSDRVIHLPETADEGRKVMELVHECGYGREEDTPQEAAIRTASLALVLANIAAGHLQGLADGTESDLGLDFVVEGGFLAGDFVSTAIDRLSRVQDRWERNLLFDVEADAPGRNRIDPIANELQNQGLFDGLMLPKARARRHFNSSQVEHQSAEKDVGHLEALRTGVAVHPVPLGSRQQPNVTGGIEWHPKIDRILMPQDKLSVILIRYRRPTLCREAIEYPVILSRTADGRILQSRSARAHLGHMLVHEQLESATALEGLQKEVESINTSHKSGGGRPMSRTNLVLCARSGLLDEVVSAGRSGSRKSRLLWLVESASECDLPDIAPFNLPDNQASVACRFGIACKQEIARRINFTDKDVRDLVSLSGQLADWRVFLREQERHLPGITYSVANLPIALCYGLESLMNHKVRVDGDQVIAYAKWLVRRMMNRISLASATHRDTSLEALAARVADKLATDGPMKVRDITRKFTRLSASDCRSALDWLADKKIVAEENGCWGILGEPNGSRIPVATADH